MKVLYKIIKFTPFELPKSKKNSHKTILFASGTFKNIWLKKYPNL